MALATSFAAREFGALLAHLGLQVGDQRRAELLSNGPAPFRALSVDRPLDLKQLIDPADRFQRQRRDHRRFLALRLATGFLTRSAITKNGRRAWTQQAASGIGPGTRLGWQSLP